MYQINQNQSKTIKNIKINQNVLKNVKTHQNFIKKIKKH